VVLWQNWEKPQDFEIMSVTATHTPVPGIWWAEGSFYYSRRTLFSSLSML